MIRRRRYDRLPVVMLRARELLREAEQAVARGQEDRPQREEMNSFGRRALRQARKAYELEADFAKRWDPINHEQWAQRRDWVLSELRRLAGEDMED
jgi:hypothetical protein